MEKHESTCLNESFNEGDSFFESIDLETIEKNASSETENQSSHRPSPSLTEKSNRIDTSKRAHTHTLSPKCPKTLKENKFKNHRKRTKVDDINQSVKKAFKNPRRISFHERKKQEQIQNAMKEINAIQEELSQSDIGPFYGLPGKVADLLFHNRKINKLYDWQHKCLELPEISRGKNLIYSLPTSGGKTLVAEILIMKQILCRKKNCIFVLPYVTIVQEKVRDLSPFAVDLNFIVEEYASNKGPLPPIKRRKSNCVYIATIEKACSLVNSLIELKRLDEIGLFVIDELHMIGESGARGARLETMLAKVKFISGKTQIIGMSATLGNTKDLQSFLSAEVFCEDFRPVQLKEFVKIDDELWEFKKELEPDLQFQNSRQFNFAYTSEMKKLDPDYLMGLVKEIVPLNSCLIFCPTKKSCENVATLVCKLLDRDIMKHRYEDKKALYKALLNEGNGKMCSILRFTLAFGVAYHHAGLTIDERRLLEEGYSNGILCCLFCTSTLAAGVNLPAKRVIIRSPYIGSSFLNNSRYKQMVGRAGRAGFDSSGESILIIKPSEKKKTLDLLQEPVQTCKSNLMYEGGKGLKVLILSVIGLEMVETKDDIIRFMANTLYSIQLCDDKLLEDAIQNALNDLETKSLIKYKSDPDSRCNSLMTTKLGKAAYKGSVDIDRAQQLYDDLEKCASSFNLVNFLNLIYVITPYEFLQAISIDRQCYLNAGKGETHDCQKNGLKQQYTKEQKKKGRRLEKETQVEFANTQFKTEDHTMVEIPSEEARSKREQNEGRIGWQHSCTCNDEVPHKKDDYMMLSAEEKQAAELIGVNEVFVQMLSYGQIHTSVKWSVAQRFYLTLIINDLWNQNSVWDVAKKYDLHRGLIQNLTQSSASFASCVLRFCQELEEFWAYQDLMPAFVKRLSYCVTMELMPLMDLPAVKKGRAKLLYKAGYKTLADVASASAAEIVKKVEFVPKKVAHQIIASAKMLLIEKAENLKEEAEDVISNLNKSSGGTSAS
ncbi:Helicase POLQ-like [Nymphon striatum]|nr:Helicase POLQ-like [Nymphon striatum]